jgi:hypothetical protein
MKGARFENERDFAAEWILLGFSKMWLRRLACSETRGSSSTIAITACSSCDARGRNAVDAMDIVRGSAAVSSCFVLQGSAENGECISILQALELQQAVPQLGRSALIQDSLGIDPGRTYFCRFPPCVRFPQAGACHPRHSHPATETCRRASRLCLAQAGPPEPRAFRAHRRGDRGGQRRGGCGLEIRCRAVAVLGALNGPWYLLFLGAALLAFIAVRNQKPGERCTYRQRRNQDDDGKPKQGSATTPPCHAHCVGEHTTGAIDCCGHASSEIANPKRVLQRPRKKAVNRGLNQGAGDALLHHRPPSLSLVLGAT